MFAVLVLVLLVALAIPIIFVREPGLKVVATAMAVAVILVPHANAATPAVKGTNAGPAAIGARGLVLAAGPSVSGRPAVAGW